MIPGSGSSPGEGIGYSLQYTLGFLGGSDNKESACQCKTHRLHPWVGKIPWRKKWQGQSLSFTTPFLSPSFILPSTPITLCPSKSSYRSIVSSMKKNTQESYNKYILWRSLPGSSVVKNLPDNAGDSSSIPGRRRSPEEGNGNPLQYSSLGNPTDRRAWRVAIYSVVKKLDATELLSTHTVWS